MRSSVALIAVLSFAVMAPVTTGCVVQEDEIGPGSLVMPLVQTGPDGASYQLNATFEIVGPGGTQVINSGSESSLTVPLPPGLTNIRLLDGWTLMKTLPGGSIPEPVSALLGTRNPITLRVLANQAATVSFGFIVRSTSGDTTLTFGVVTDPREFAGGMRISEGTGDLAPYAAGGPSSRPDFAFYFELEIMDSVILPDGTREHVYFAGYDALAPTPIVGEFFNDAFGVLSNLVGPSLAGGFLEYHIGAKPDGSIEFRGTLFGSNPPFTTIEFGPYTLRASVPLDADGFPADVFFHDDSVPFTMVTFFDSGEATMSGFFNLRHIP